MVINQGPMKVGQGVIKITCQQMVIGYPQNDVTKGQNVSPESLRSINWGQMDIAEVVMDNPEPLFVIDF